MKWMESDATTPDIINWVGKEMINIDQQPGKHQGVALQPGFLVESCCKWQRN